MSQTTTTRHPRRGGRPSRGERFTLTTKIPVAYRDKLHAWVDHEGKTITDYLADLVLADLDAREVPETSGQEAFDLKSA